MHVWSGQLFCVLQWSTSCTRCQSLWSKLGMLGCQSIHSPLRLVCANDRLMQLMQQSFSPHEGAGDEAMFARESTFTLMDHESDSLVTLVIIRKVWCQSVPIKKTEKQPGQLGGRLGKSLFRWKIRSSWSSSLFPLHLDLQMLASGPGVPGKRHCLFTSIGIVKET